MSIVFCILISNTLTIFTITLKYMTKGCALWQGSQFRRWCYRPPRVQIHRQHARERGSGPRIAASHGQLPVWALPGKRPWHPEADQPDAYSSAAIDEPWRLAGLHGHGKFQLLLKVIKLISPSDEGYRPEMTAKVKFKNKVMDPYISSRFLTRECYYVLLFLQHRRKCFRILSKNSHNKFFGLSHREV